jgi:hypothetical protein
MNEANGGLFMMTSKERVDIIIGLIESIYTLDGFRSIIECREELISEIYKEIEEVEKAISVLEANGKFLEIESY